MLSTKQPPAQPSSSLHFINGFQIQAQPERVLSSLPRLDDSRLCGQQEPHAADDSEILRLATQLPETGRRGWCYDSTAERQQWHVKRFFHEAYDARTIADVAGEGRFFDDAGGPFCEGEARHECPRFDTRTGLPVTRAT